MDKGRGPFIVSTVIAAVSLLAAAWYGEGMTIGICLTALLVTVMAMLYCAPGTYMISLTAASVTFACTVLMMLMIPSDAVVTEPPTEFKWTLISAVIQGAALITQTMLFMYAAAAMFRMSLNWVMISGIGWLVAMGLSVSRYLAVLAFQNEEVAAGMVNASIVFGMLVHLIMFIIFFAVVGRVFKNGRLIITAAGSEAMH